MTAIVTQHIDIVGFSGNSATKLLVQRLEYWFRGKKKNGFFKFLSPCNHNLYRTGDSWTEELGISRRTFNRHFDTIGIRWTSKSSFKRAGDPFLDKPYACYYDRKENMTRYFKNPNLAMNGFTGKAQELASSLLKLEKEAVQGQVSKKLEHRSLFNKKGQNTASLDGQNDRSRPAKMTAPLYTRITTDKYNYLSSERDNILNEIQEIWKKEVGGKTYTSESFLKKLYETFVTLFKGSLEAWKAYCRKIASSKFLMGEVSEFRAWISWAIKPETIEKLEAGEYTLGDRVSESLFKEKEQEIALEVLDNIKILNGKEKDIHEFMRNRVGERLYLSWFKDLQIVCTIPNNPVLAVGSNFRAEYIQNTFQRDLEALKIKFFVKEGRMEIVK